MFQDQKTLLISYVRQTGQFSCLSQPGAACLMWQAFCQNEADTTPLRKLAQAIAVEDIPQAKFLHLHIGGKICHACVLLAAPQGDITITLSDAASEQTDSLDPLTRLMTKDAFCQAVERQLRADPEGEYCVAYINFRHFKVINDLFSRAKGDELLRCIADVFRSTVTSPGLSCRITSDHFALLLHSTLHSKEQIRDVLQTALETFDIPFEIVFYTGFYKIVDRSIPADTMIDRAAMALASIKGNYNVRYAFYNTEMRKALLSEQEIIGMTAAALAEKQFLIHYQPQYNHSTGMLVGAEALVRWMHPENGLIPPGSFIPIFERNGFITNLDLYVFEAVCAFLRKSMDSRWSIVPISVNFSRYDVFVPNFVQQLEDIRQKYGIPAKYLRVELTESVMVGGPEYINDVIGKLHSCGYIVEMDDFGSGYSSLNVLKDMDLDIIKLDMRFLSQSSHSNKGGTILSSVVRMAKWLGLPVIAEGVETVEQADFLRSIGCEYIQGYLYSKPLPEEQYIALVSASRIGATVPQMDLIDTMNAYDFWDPKSQETLIFSNYVGAAAIIDFRHGELELLRVNKKYLQELGMNLSEKELIQSDPLAVMDRENQAVYLKMLEDAIETGDEQECETWWSISSSCCGDERFCIRSSVRVIGVSGDRYLFHSMIRNITAERLYYDSLRSNDLGFRTVTEHANIYFWEYHIPTKEMHPCFRCMRDLGLPPVVTNYPDSAIEAGIFPPEVADMYRDLMKQIDAGAPSMEAIIPLTADRIPFHVRYTTEFDENGYPIKAYGSATLVVD